MESTNYAQILSERILALRKEKGLTQEALAQQLGVSFQAVSKWENGQSCPDIALLPLLADIFAVPVGSLFGREAPGEQTARREEEWGNNPVFSACDKLPWPDDDILRGVVCWGRKILSHEKPLKKLFTFDVKSAEYTWLLRYSPLNVTAECNIHVEGDVQGDAKAGGGINCGAVGNDAKAGGGINCGTVGNDAKAGGGINCATVGNDAKAGANIACVNIHGSANAGLSIECQDIGGDAKAPKITIKKQG